MRFRWNEAAWRRRLGAWRKFRCALYSKRPALRSLPSALSATHGSALVLVLVMITFITIIVSAMLMGNLLQLRFTRNAQHELQARYLAEAGIHKTIWLLAGNEGKDITWRPQNESVMLFENQTANISITEWGGFLRVTATAHAHRAGSTIRVLLGEKPPLAFQRALLVGATDYPLVVTGKNRIIGDVTVNSQGVRTGRIMGRDFEGEHVVDGRIFRVRNPQMPEFDASLLEKTIARCQQFLSQPGGAQIYEDLFFHEPAQLARVYGQILHVEGNVHIQSDSVIRGPLRLSCSGNIRIAGRAFLRREIELIAKGKIIITEQAQLQDCILFAEEGIEISGAAQISGQLLSPREIVLRDRARLHYPSLVYVRGELLENRWHGQIVLQDQASLRGTIILPGPRTSDEGSYNDMMVSLHPQSKIVGAIYSAHNTEQRGTVYGSVITGQFWLYEAPTIYLNWLRDALIDRTKLPQEFLLPLQFSPLPRLGVLSWEEVATSAK